MKFSKMHGLGNDYIFVDTEKEKIADPDKLAQKLSDRHFSIGSDGLVLIGSSDKADFSMRIFNADGSEAEMCGNAIRCVGKYVYEKGLHAGCEVSVETPAGIKRLYLDIKEGRVERVRVNMGAPVLDPRLIPVRVQTKAVMDYPLRAGRREYLITAVSMGNPHCVIFTDTLADGLPEEVGLISRHSLFPKQTNVEFVKVISQTEIQLLVYERGSGETLACGTGACAGFYAAYIKGKVAKQVKARLKGGELDLELKDDNIFMSGPARFSYEGEYFNGK
jgi:diaminopimelate epimerase